MIQPGQAPEPDAALDAVRRYAVDEFRSGACTYFVWCFLAIVVGLAITAVMGYAIWWLFWLTVILLVPGMNSAWAHILEIAVMTSLLVIAVTTSRGFNANERHPRDPSLAGGVLGMLLWGTLIGIPPTSRSAPHLFGIFTDLVFFGPRLLAQSWPLFWAGCEALFGDAEGCARVLLRLFEKRKRIDVEDLRALESGLDVDRVLRQMRYFPGVIFLDREHPALTLTDSFRERLAGIISRAAVDRSGASRCDESEPGGQHLQAEGVAGEPQIAVDEQGERG